MIIQMKFHLHSSHMKLHEERQTDVISGDCFLKPRIYSLIINLVSMADTVQRTIAEIQEAHVIKTQHFNRQC